MKEVKKVQDMLGRKITLPLVPQRIVSLVPSQTELLFELGLEKRVVGITKFCIKPNEWYRTKTRVGGTKKVDFAKIKQLNPDLIIANKEENTQEEIEQLAKDFPVWVSDINSYKEALISIRSIATLCNKQEKGIELINTIEQKKSNYQKHLKGRKTVLYFIWKNPWMVAGQNTYINDILYELGFDNIINEERYPLLDIQKSKQLSPDYVFLSSEPYPFKEKHIKELQELFPLSHIKLVDGELFSWYGSRLLNTFDFCVS